MTAAVSNLEAERERTRRIVTLLMQGRQHKQIAFLAKCSMNHVHQVRYRYLREKVQLVLKPEGESLLDGSQLRLPFPKKRGTHSYTSLILRRLGK